MDEKIYSLAKELNELLNKDERVLRLNQLEKELDDSYEVYNLSLAKDRAIEEYSRIKELYGEDSQESKSTILLAKQAKEDLNSHPLVKEYLTVYSEVRNLYLSIDQILFSDLRKDNK